MTGWKMPPKAKIYEALSAVADGRVTLKEACEAEVASSDGERTYTVQWSDDLRRFSSSDNASHWQGYTGYPIIAVLLLTGRIHFETETAAFLAGVPWKHLNDRFKRDYAKAVDYVLLEVARKGGDRAAIVQQVESIYTQLAALQLEHGTEKKKKIAPS